MPLWNLPQEFALLVAPLAWNLQTRSEGRLHLLLVGVLFASGRRTVAAWLRGFGVDAVFQPYYFFLSTLGRRAERIGNSLRGLVLRLIPEGCTIDLAIDDTPTERYGRCVEGCGRHRDPSPGPAGGKYLYGHVWTVAAIVVHHPGWGAIALPLFGRLYIRRKDLATLSPKRNWVFETKIQHAVGFIESFGRWAAAKKWKARVLVDGGYAARAVLEAAKAAGLKVVSRLRRDAALFDVPRGPTGRRGRPRKYGPNVIDLAKRAGSRGGWTTEEVVLYGKPESKRYKTFLATWQPAGGAIRVVVVKEPDGRWAAFFTTELDATAAQVLEAVSDRGAIEQCFHSVKEEVGAGQQQVRHLWASIGAFNLCLWSYTLVEVWAWSRSASELVDRSASPWDDPQRRPSHADKRRALRRACVRKEFEVLGFSGRNARKQKAFVEKLFAIAA